MRLVVNVRGLTPSLVGGLETVFREVFGRILRWRPEGLRATILTCSQSHDSFEPWRDLGDLRRLPDDATSEELAREIGGADLLYCPLMFLQPWEAQVPAVVFIPDLQHEEYPEFFSTEILALRTKGLRASAGRAEAVITVSEFSADQIRRSFRLPASRVVPIYPDAAESFRSPASPQSLEELRARLDLPREWMLMPANNWPHKNHRRVFRALARYREQHGEPPTLLLTGANVGSVDIAGEVEAAGVEGLVRHLGWLDEREMPLLYDGASCLMFTTLFEGFGIPLVEAMRRGTPILGSWGSSTAEIAGHHATLVDPKDEVAIADGLHAVLESGPPTGPRRESAREWAERFSYDRAARSTWEVLKSVVAGHCRAPYRLSVESWPRFFVVTPSLDQASYLRHTIDSVLDQPYPHLSYFVADGGSTDGSLEILRSYGARLRWVSRPDGGQAAAVSEAWNSSDAEIVAYINSDDIYLPLAISKVAEAMLRRPAASVIYGKAWVIDKSGHRLRPYRTAPFSATRLAEECFISQPAAFVRRDVFRVVAPLDPDLQYCMDYDLWIRLSRWFELHYLDEYLAGAREHADTKTLRDRAEVYREVLEVATRHFGMPSRSWSVGAILHHCEQEVARTHASEPVERQLHERARLVQQEEARIVGPPYADRWAGTATLLDVFPDTNGSVRLAAESPFWPHHEPLRIRIQQDGQPLGETTVERRGAFELGFSVQTNGEPGGCVRVLLRANRTFVPIVHGYSELDDRPISFLLR